MASIFKKPTRRALLKFARSNLQGCPVCKASETVVDADRPENQDGTVVQACSCRACGSSWCECFYRGDITEVEVGSDLKEDEVF